MKLANLVKFGLIILVSILAIFTVVQAGTITPPSGTPSANFYTLSDIYNFITSNTTATEGSHSFTFSDSLAGSGKNLTEIYNALASLISADKVKLSTTYLGTAGALVPSGGNAAVANVLSGKTYFGDSQADWTLQTGTMTNNGSFSLTAGASDQPVTAGYYSGGTLAGDADLTASNIKNGVNIFEVPGTLITNPTYGDNNPTKVLNTATNPGTFDPNTISTYNTLNLSVGTVKSGTTFGVSSTGDYPSVTYPLSGDTGASDAAASNILSGFEAWTKAGSLITGTVPTQTLSAGSGTVSAGYYNATTLSTVDADLIAGNILNGVTIFGVSGNVNAGYTYGDSIQSTVLTTATGAGTYNVSNLSNSVVKQGTTWGVSLGSTGTLTPDGGTAGVADLFNGKTANLTADYTLDTGTLDLACNTTTFNGTANLIATAYDGSGDGTNRWCITNSGDAIAGDMLSGKIAWVDGLAVTGTIPTQTLSAANDTVSAGYYAATTLSAVDADLAAGNIQSGVTIFGVAGSAAGYTYGDSNAALVLGTATGAGTALKNLWNGTSGAFTGGSQANGGADDYNNGGSAPSDRYTMGWTVLVKKLYVASVKHIRLFILQNNV